MSVKTHYKRRDKKTMISEEIKAVERPKKTQVRKFGDKYYVVPYTTVRVKGRKNPVKRHIHIVGT